MWKWLENNFVKPLGDIMSGIEYLQEMFEKSVDGVNRVNAIRAADVCNKEKEIAELKVKIAELEGENCRLYEQLYEYTDNNEKCTRLDSCAQDAIKEIKSAAEKAIKDTQQDIADLNILMYDYKNKLQSLIEESTNSVTKSLQERNEDYQELIECMYALCGLGYNSDIVEFFALKTYRGWKFICQDGVSTIDFDDVKGVEVCWKKGGRVRVVYECDETKSD